LGLAPSTTDRLLINRDIVYQAIDDAGTGGPTVGRFRWMGEQFHLDADTFLAMIREEIPTYDELQAALAQATTGSPVQSILDLGSGTGETAIATLRQHPEATLVGVDSSDDMLSIARQRLPSATFITSRLQDPLPHGPFDVVVSALAIHHLDAVEKASLFRRVKEVMSPEGRFVMLDVAVPTELVASPIRLEEGVDKPSSVAEMLQWMDEAGLRSEIVYGKDDLAILKASPL
jgi:tRNA (cmo5U34)-methyltransferase